MMDNSPFPGRDTRGRKVPNLVWKLLVMVHVLVRRLSGGRVGTRFRGINMLLLEHVGARSGRRHVTPLLYGRDGDNIVLVASKGGAARNPAWYTNLVANPEVSVEVAGRHIPVHAETASPEEKARLWKLMVQLWPDYEQYQRSTDRQIPVVILKPQTANSTGSQWSEF